MHLKVQFVMLINKSVCDSKVQMDNNNKKCQEVSWPLSMAIHSH